MISSATTTTSSSKTISTNVKKQHTKFYDTKVVEWLTKGGGEIYDEKNVNVLKYNKDDYILNYDEDISPKYDYDKDVKVNENVNVNINIDDDNEINSSFQTSQEDYFKQGEESSSSKGEGSFQEESIQSFEENLQLSSSSSNSTSSTPYSAELVQTSSTNGSFSSSSNENEPLSSSPTRPLKAMTKSNINDNKRTSNVYEVLQEIKPEHPLRINTQFEFTTNNSRSTSLLHNSISHNPLSHHHRNSTLYIDNSSPTSTRNSRRNSRNSVNYTPPRRYSNIQRPSIFYENKNGINNYFNVIQEKNEKNIINIDNLNNNNNEVNKKFDKNNDDDNNNYDDDDENIMYIKYFFWVGFLFMPVWWFGSFYKPKGTEDYEWRRRCRLASIWFIVALAIAIIIFLIAEQRRKSGM